MPLDVPTLIIVSIFVTAILGLLLLFVWVQDRSIQALAWWGVAYLVAGCSIALLSGRLPVSDAVSIDIASAFLFAACGLSWNGARLFDDKPVRPFAMFAGALIWLLACLIPAFAASPIGRTVVSSLIVSNYTLVTAFELWSGRAEKLVTRWPAMLVLMLHGIIFPSQIPLLMMQPGGREAPLFSSGWMALLALETLLYAIATAFIVLAMAKERNEKIHKTAASTDPLTGVPNRRAVMDAGRQLIRRTATPERPVAALMFDLDFFKAVNDRFGHAIGDRVLKVFASTATANLRSTDIFGRLGGEEFAAILPNMDIDAAVAAAERVRLAFYQAAIEIDGHPVRGSLSAGITVTNDSTDSLDALLSVADEALYVAKSNGRNRVEVASKHHWQPSAPVENAPTVRQPEPAEIRVKAGPAEKVRACKEPAAAALRASDAA
ncbi:MAG TPA: GGDEF domain-containing protein [Xanthobacteraceae bacterium]|nr:GGDEF domain-containing protein [Xanthobacteraceae bacterium]